MSIQCMSWVFDHSSTTGGERLVLLAVANHADAKGEDAWPSYDTLAGEARMSRRQVIRCIANLERDSRIRVAKGAGAPARGGRSNLYSVVMEMVPGDNLSPLPGTQGGSEEVTDCPKEVTPMSPPSPPERGDICAEEVTSATERGDTHVTRTTNEPSLEPSDYTPPSPPSDEPGTALVPASASAAPTGAEERIFDAWRESTGKPRAHLDGKRRKLIRARLREYPEEDLIDAVRGWRHSAHHRGENDRRTTYNDLGLLLRDATHVEQFRDLEQNPPGPQLVRANSKPSTVERSWRNIRAALAEEA